MLHTPVTQPEMLNFGHALSPGFEEFVVVSPYMIHADEGIHSLEAREARSKILSGACFSKRGCVFSLQFLRNFIDRAMYF